MVAKIQLIVKGNSEFFPDIWRENCLIIIWVVGNRNPWFGWENKPVQIKY
ncbi:MAG: hypothetical protein DSM107014_01930 [Gomphosphaeria aponina SAG 52.96 = DSM 107014]|uniref:Uncharacterized protein n=1 Tax=Gomphosphaeria aponina SAG 52.96 = DSM 107014 TaxID=1521640 RepID=A0A941GM51_9CHRO|nr:hypothetical protein [Gomphosphaeria aponina SAG 52.96 = DSM 107014]